MTEPTQADAPVDENALVKQAMEALEAEGLAESEKAVSSPFPPGVKMDPCVAPSKTAPLVEASPIQLPPMEPTYIAAPIPLADLRERIEICAKAWVQRYRDGNVEIVFDTEARKAAGPASNETQRF